MKRSLMSRAFKLPAMVFLTGSWVMLSSCTFISQKPYADSYPEPCTSQWFMAIEEELKIVDAKTERPTPGSSQWLKAADDKLSVFITSGHPLGSIEWCHQVHQALIGL